MTFIGWNERLPGSSADRCPPVMWPRIAPNAVVAGGGTIAFAEPLGGGEAAGEQADRGGLDIALAAGDLAGEAQARHRLQAQRAVEQLRRIEEGVAVQAAEPGELRVLEAGDHAEDVGLDGVAQPRLEADHVVERAERVVLAELDDGIGLVRRLVRGLVSPTGFIGPWRSVSRPRSAITSIGRQPSK